jgi:hypothetical protein
LLARQRVLGSGEQAVGRRRGAVVVQGARDARQPDAARERDLEVLQLRVDALDLHVEVLLQGQLHGLVDAELPRRSAAALFLDGRGLRGRRGLRRSAGCRLRRHGPGRWWRLGGRRRRLALGRRWRRRLCASGRGLSESGQWRRSNHESCEQRPQCHQRPHMHQGSLHKRSERGRVVLGSCAVPCKTRGRPRPAARSGANGKIDAACAQSVRAGRGHASRRRSDAMTDRPRPSSR